MKYVKRNEKKNEDDLLVFFLRNKLLKEHTHFTGKSDHHWLRRKMMITHLLFIVGYDEPKLRL